MDARRKLLVIGLDGATMDIIEPLVKRGEMPNIAKLIETGASGRLASIFPPVTPPSWTSMTSGKNPAKHGIFDFTLDPFKPQPSMAFVNANAVQCPRFWELLKHTDLKTGVVNLPVSYPPAQMNGFQISGMDTPSDKVTFSYPPELIDELKAQGINYRAAFFFPYEKRSGGHEAIQQLMFRDEEAHKDAFVYLLKNKPWDVFFGVFMLTDKVGHFFWHLQDRAASTNGDTLRVAKPIQDAYRLVDGFVGEILQTVDENTYVMLASDHGFGSKPWTLFLNAWLRREGFLNTKPLSLGSVTKNMQMRRVTQTGAQVLQKLKLGPLRAVVPSALLKRRFDFSVPALRQSVNSVDWTSTKSYASAYGIYINVKGRTPDGIVEPGKEYDRVREQIQERFESLQVPDGSNKPVGKLLKKEEVYSGPHFDEAPDLVLDFRNFHGAVLPSCAFRFSRLWAHRPNFGTHDFDGMFILKGPGVKAGHKMTDAKVMDVCPTMLYLLNQPIPTDFDGQVMQEAIAESHWQSHPPSFQQPQEIALDRGNVAETYSDDEAALVAERLRQLGYIE